MNKIQKIREVCIKVNPEIVELKFGCNFNWKAKTSNYSGYYRINEVNEKLNVIKAYNLDIKKKISIDDNIGDFTFDNFKDPKQHIKIIGRPIRLADVLLAMSKIGTVTKGAKFLVNIVEIGHGVRGSGLFQDVRWNLTDDNLEHQSEETLTFISNLLKP